MQAAIEMSSRNDQAEGQGFGGVNFPETRMKGP